MIKLNNLNILKSDIMETEEIIIIDIGSRYCKSGFLHTSEFISVTPTSIGIENDSVYIGKEAEDRATIEELEFPISHGTIESVDSLTSILNYIFNNELKIDPESQSILITEPSLNSKENRQKLMDILFGTYNVDKLFIANQALLSFLSSGKFSGIVIESGGGVTQVAPVFKGLLAPYAINRVDFGGEDLTEYLSRQPSIINAHIEKKKYLKFLEEIKKNACYVEKKYKKHLNSVEPYEYTFPDGNKITLKEERTTIPEAIFRPELLGKSGIGIHELLFDSISRIKESEQQNLFENIIISGGNTMFPGFEDKLLKKIKKKYNSTKNSHFSHSLNKMNTVLEGAQSFCSALNPENDFITRDEYYESGIDYSFKKMDKIQYIKTV